MTRIELAAYLGKSHALTIAGFDKNAQQEYFDIPEEAAYPDVEMQGPNVFGEDAADNLGMFDYDSENFNPFSKEDSSAAMYSSGLQPLGQTEDPYLMYYGAAPSEFYDNLPEQEQQSLLSRLGLPAASVGAAGGGLANLAYNKLRGQPMPWAGGSKGKFLASMLGGALAGKGLQSLSSILNSNE